MTDQHGSEERVSDERLASWKLIAPTYKGRMTSWEPVIVRGGRKRTRQQVTVRDWVSVPITLRKGLVGAKPPEFVRWLLEVLNVQQGDTLDDLYPGSGVVGIVNAQTRIVA